MGLFYIAFIEHFEGSAGVTSWIHTLTLSMRTGYALFTPATSFIGCYFNKRHALTSGLAYSGVGLGILSLPPVMQLCIERRGWRGALLILAGMSAIIFVSASLLRPVRSPASATELDAMMMMTDTEHSEALESTDDPRYMRSGADKNTHESRTTSKLLVCRCFGSMGYLFDINLFSDVVFVICMLVSTIQNIGMAVSFIHLAPMIDSFGSHGSKTAFVLSLQGIGTFVGSLMWGFIITRNRLKIVHCYSCMLCLFGVVMFMVPFMAHLAAISVTMVIIGFVRGGISSQTSVYIRAVVGDGAMTNVFGWWLLFGGIGQMVGGVLSGYIRGFTGSYDVSFYTAGVTVIFSGILLWHPTGGIVTVQTLRIRNHEPHTAIYL
uniref:Monocarboxylate transporter 12-like n=1 Tax=Saccoglossus kowalevskii TaxID=10224 RepID=A0ABM0M453_SACKO|nr:PREDICTED: monocarboxylate transporter 12-like [Saccoglossus kowalevskii]